jgi:hypothetical protein
MYGFRKPPLLLDTIHSVRRGIAVIEMVAAFVAQDMQTPLHSPLAYPSSSSVPLYSLNGKTDPLRQHRACCVRLTLLRSVIWLFWAEDSTPSNAFQKAFWDASKLSHVVSFALPPLVVTVVYG